MAGSDAPEPASSEEAVCDRPRRFKRRSPSPSHAQPELQREAASPAPDGEPHASAPQPAAAPGPASASEVQPWCYRPPDWVPLAIRPEPTVEYWPESHPGHYLHPGTVFDVDLHRWSPSGVLFLRLADGRGWVFDKKPGVGVMCVPYSPSDAEVYLCTYKLALPCRWLLRLLSTVMRWEEASAYHVGVSVFGREWAFYGGAQGTGVRYLPRGAWAPELCQEVSLGRTRLTEREVNRILRDLEAEWPSSGYKFLSRNCCHFATELASRLDVGPLPDNVLRLDIYATREVVSVVRSGKTMRGRSPTETFRARDFCFGLAGYATRHRSRESCCPRIGCFGVLCKPCDSIRGIVTLLRRMRRDPPLARTASSADGVGWTGGATSFR